jgi:hypothetical protein
MQIKVNRAIRDANMLPMATREIMASIPKDLLATLTSKQIVLVMQALNTHWHKACAYKADDILGEGAIWDPRASKMREIEQ